VRQSLLPTLLNGHFHFIYSKNLDEKDFFQFDFFIPLSAVIIVLVVPQALQSSGIKESLFALSFETRIIP
jgi:surface polysaccharide O-acyltransferase-like enzyme